MLKALGRLSLAAVFIYGGWSALKTPGGRVDMVAKAGVPQPEQAVKLNGLAMIFGGLLLTIGRFPRVAAATLLGAVIPTTIIGHAFWREEEGAARNQQLIHFLKNLSSIGALLLILQERQEKQEA